MQLFSSWMWKLETVKDPEGAAAAAGLMTSRLHIQAKPDGRLLKNVFI